MKNLKIFYNENKKIIDLLGISKKNFILLKNNFFNEYMFNVLLDLIKNFKSKEDISLIKDFILRRIFNGPGFGVSKQEIQEILIEKNIDDIINSGNLNDGYFIRDVLYKLGKLKKLGKESDFLLSLINNDYEYFNRYFLDRFEIYNNKKEIQRILDEYKNSGIIIENLKYTELDGIIYDKITFKEFSKKRFLKELTGIFGFTVHYKDFDIEKLQEIGIEKIKGIIKRKGIENFSFDISLDVFLGKISDEELIKIKKYDIMKSKFGAKFTSLKKENKDYLLKRFNISELKKIKLRELRSIIYSTKEEYEFEDSFNYEFKNEMMESITDSEMNWFIENVGIKSIRNKEKYFIIKIIGIEESEKILKEYQEDYGIGKSKFLNNAFRFGKNYIKKLKLSTYFGEEFDKLGSCHKNFIYENYDSNYLIDSINKGNLKKFIKEVKYGLSGDELLLHKDYSKFKKDFGKNFTSFNRDFRKKFLNIGYKEIKNFQNENKIQKELILKSYLYCRDMILKGRLICKNCGSKNDLNSFNIYKKQIGLNFCSCNRFRSSFERIIFEFIRSNYEGEILINHKFLKIGGRKREIDIYIPEIKFGIEFNGIFYHGEGLDDNSKLKLEKSKELGIDLLFLNENNFIKRKTLNKKTRDLILDYLLNKKNK